MMLCPPKSTRNLAFALAVTAAISLAGPAGGLADPAADVPGPSDVREISPPGRVEPRMTVGPPADDPATAGRVGLASAAIIRPLKNKSFALALVARTPAREGTPGPPAASSRLPASTLSSVMQAGEHDLQWVLLTELPSVSAGASTPPASAHLDAVRDQDAWQYAVEVVFVPMASLSLRAALSLTPDEAGSSDIAPAPEAVPLSRIGVSIGLDYRPAEGVTLDFDYARFMPGGALTFEKWLTPPPDGPEPEHGSGTNVFTTRLSIEF